MVTWIGRGCFIPKPPMGGNRPFARRRWEVASGWGVCSWLEKWNNKYINTVFSLHGHSATSFRTKMANFPQNPFGTCFEKCFVTLPKTPGNTMSSPSIDETIAVFSLSILWTSSLVRSSFDLRKGTCDQTNETHQKLLLGFLSTWETGEKYPPLKF